MSTVEPTRVPRADAARNRRRILSAASHLFAKRGTDATLNDVAREAGVGVGTVYRKFADKDALLDALFEVKIEQLLHLADEAVRESDPALAFHHFVLAVMEARATDRGLGAVVMRTAHGESFAAALGRRLDPQVDQLIRRAQAAGELREGLTGEDVCILAMMVGTVADHTRETSPGIWRRYAQVLLDGTRPTATTGALSPGPPTIADTAAALSPGAPTTSPTRERGGKTMSVDPAHS